MFQHRRGKAKGDYFRLVGRFRVANRCLEVVPGQHPNLEQAVDVFAYTSYAVTLNLLQESWQMTKYKEADYHGGA